MFCNNSCANNATLPLLTQLCGIGTREEVPAKLVLIRCDVAVPTGGNDAALAAALDGLLTAGTMAVSGHLKNFLWGDPSTAAVSYADINPEEDIVTGRELTFDDYNTFNVDPTLSNAPYYDRVFWATVTSGSLWNFGYTTSDGKLYLFTNAAGNEFLTGKLSIYRGEDRSQAGKVIEVKKGKVKFLTDPLQFASANSGKPFLDLAAQVAAYPSLRDLY